MMGRAAYKEPWRLIDVDSMLFGAPAPFASPQEAAEALLSYVGREVAAGVRANSILRHVVGLFHGVPGARAFRRHVARKRSSRAPAPRCCATRSRSSRQAAFRRPKVSRPKARRRDGPDGTPGTAAMIFGVSFVELAILAAAIAAGAVLTGLLAGLFGIGGGGVIVPVLYEVFRVLGVSEDIRMQLCIGTSFAIIIPTTFRSYFTHRTREIGLDRRGAPVGAAGGGRSRDRGGDRGGRAGRRVQGVAFAVIAGLIAVKLLFGRASWRIADDLPQGPAMLGFGYLIGLSSSLMGVSGGSMSNIIMTLYGKSIHTAVATSAGLGVPIAVAGTVGFMAAGLPHQSLMPPLCIGYVSLLGFVVMAPISSYVAGFRGKARPRDAASAAGNHLRAVSRHHVGPVHRQPGVTAVAAAFNA